MSRTGLDELFDRTRQAGGTAFMPFLTAGLPAPASTVDAFVAMSESGADAFAVGTASRSAIAIAEYLPNAYTQCVRNAVASAAAVSGSKELSARRSSSATACGRQFFKRMARVV